MKSLFTKRLLAALTLLVVSTAGIAFAQTADLVISEYVEGAGNNRAIEIFNGTEDSVSLGAYALLRYSNGSTVPFSIALPSINLAPGAAHVLVYSLADPSLLAYADQTDANLNFNGNDALVLVFGGSTVVDSFGRVGEDPGTAWTCTGGSTVNHTMRRLSSICSGDAAPADAFNPCVGWVFFTSDTFNGLGNHVVDCGAVADEGTTWGDLKAIYR